MLMKILGQNIRFGKSLSERDEKVIWHPLTQHKTAAPLKAIKKAKGVWLEDEDGKQYIDAISSWYTSMYGHCNSKIRKAVSKQMEKLDQVVFSGFTHEPAVELAEKLLEILPQNQAKLFFNDNGSTATEIGIKMALQYHHNQGHKRHVMLALEEGFHGDTFGAMSVSGLSVYNGAFEKHFIEVIRLPKPVGYNNDEVINLLQQWIETYEIAGFIYEPLVQGAAGMKTYSKAGLEDILKLCKLNDIICIADEVMTGFGKTGKTFASQYMQTSPDVICLSKALSAGMVPMGITSCSQKIYDAFYDDELSKGLFHGHTYTGNPLACAAALASIKLLQSEEIQQQIKNIMSWHQSFAIQLKQHPKIAEVRQIGMILAFDLSVKMERYGSLRNELYDYFMQKGIFLRPLGNTIYILTPFVIKKEEMQQVYDSILSCVEEVI
ncbi:adenosylmethionine--8-amino-7-oxononanoate aminotransferase BioA [Psychroflexus salis]|uniref:Adenosylmethionine-8-amino-7-oxononanoate aminotransferase n=2 Tax=Psychroflexus salis TaxID=1526574 RepID=A0A917A1A9_9FLAO|nr:adenosylmethionine--8-amino-7-oxononanoate aminotransferase BioA [Psychroflexus salis]